jgi:ankyrin repeat protein
MPFVDVPVLRSALPRKVALITDDVVEILDFLVDCNPELLSSRHPNGSLPLQIACRRGTASAVVQSLVNFCKASVNCVTSEGDLPLCLAGGQPSLDTIFLLMKLHPHLVYRGKWMLG